MWVTEFKILLGKIASQCKTDDEFLGVLLLLEKCIVNARKKFE